VIFRFQYKQDQLQDLLSKISDTFNFKKPKRWRGIFIRAIIILQKTFAGFSAKL